jgi:tyrosyl-tRNA synthetase
MGQDAQVVMLMPLLVGLDGKEKMSQSLGNFISIVDEPYEMFGKTMSIPDSLMESWFTLCTDVPLEEVASLIAGNPRDAKMRLAKEIVAIYHGASAGDEAEDYFVRTFSKREEPVDAPTAQIPPELLADGSAPIAPLIHALGLTASIGEARRIIKGGGVSIGARKVSEPFAALPVGELDGKVLRVGKHKFRTLKA